MDFLTVLDAVAECDGQLAARILGEDVQHTALLEDTMQELCEAEEAVQGAQARISRQRQLITSPSRRMIASAEANANGHRELLALRKEELKRILSERRKLKGELQQLQAKLAAETDTLRAKRTICMSVSRMKLVQQGDGSVVAQSLESGEEVEFSTLRDDAAATADWLWEKSAESFMQSAKPLHDIVQL
eukprot:Polyplicarium_translucidae@DN1199_c0_g1_i2.p1